MASSEEPAKFIDRCESLLKSPAASQISANKSLVREFVYSEVDGSSSTVEADSSGSTEDCVQTVSKTERSEVTVDIEGLRETTLSSSETVVTSRIRTVYDRSLSGSTSSTDLDHKELLAEAHHEQEDAVFGENACIDGEQRQRKTSDSYFISQTYQVNTGEKTSKSVTAVRSVSFRSSKDVEIGDHGSTSQDSDLHFVDRCEERIAGAEPDVVGSPKEKHVRFLWYDNDQEDIEALKRIQSARENVQQLIESTYMVSDIADVIDDNCMGPESNHLTAPRSGNSLVSEESQVEQSAERKYEVSIEEANQNLDISFCPGSREIQDLNVAGHSASDTSQSIHVQEVSTSDMTQMIKITSASSTQATWGLDVASYSSVDGTQRFDTSQSVSFSTTKPTSFPAEFESWQSLTAGRESPPTLAYSPGMAIRSYALEELAEKKCMVSSDRIDETATSSRSDAESSSVNDLSSLNAHSIAQLTSVQKVSTESNVADVFNNHQHTAANGNFLPQEMSKEEYDESLDKLVDLESLLVGYRFHDVGIMQESGGICNLAFDDSDEHETVLVSSSEYRSSSLYPGDVANIGVSLSEAVPLHSAYDPTSSQLLTESKVVSPHTQGPHSALDHSSSADTSVTVTSFAQGTSVLASASQKTSILDSESHDTPTLTSASQKTSILASESHETPTLASASQKTSILASESHDTPTLASSIQKTSILASESHDTPTLAATQKTSILASESHDTPTLASASQKTSILASESHDTPTLVSAIQETPTEVRSLVASEDSILNTEATQKTVTSENKSYTAQVEQNLKVYQTENVSQTTETVDQSSTVSSSERLELRTGEADGFDADSENIVKELDSIIEAGEKVIKELSQSLEKEEFEKLVSESRKTQRQTKEVEDISRSKEAEMVYGIQAGGVSSGSYTSADVSPGLRKKHKKKPKQSRASRDVVDSAAYSHSGETSVTGAWNMEYTREGDNASSSAVKVDNYVLVSSDGGTGSSQSSTENTHVTYSNETESATHIEADNSATTCEVVASTRKSKAKNKTQIKKAVNVSSSRKSDIVTSTKEIGDAAFHEKNKNATVFSETEDSTQVHAFGTAVIRTSAYSSGNRNSTATGEVKYAAHTMNAESSTCSSEVTSITHTKEEEISSNLTQANQKSEVLNVFQDETFANSEGHAECIIETSEATQVENIQDEVMAARSSVNIRTYIQNHLADTSNAKTDAIVVKSNTFGAGSVKGASRNEEAEVTIKTPEVPAYITRRFNVSSKFEAVLKSQGATLQSESLNIAVYFDTPNYDLTLADCWLRSVNGKWQLHSNFTKLLNDLTLKEYSESEDTNDIVSFITDLLKSPVPAESDASIAMVIQRAGLREFARYITRQKTYLLNGMTVNLELSGYGFWVGSVTAAAPSQSRLHEAVGRIDTFWRTTGVQALNLLAG